MATGTSEITTAAALAENPVVAEAIDRIVETGQLVVDEEESLDLDDIDEEEDRFWSESWDEPEEW